MRLLDYVAGESKIMIGNEDRKTGTLLMVVTCLAVVCAPQAQEGPSLCDMTVYTDAKNALPYRDQFEVALDAILNCERRSRSEAGGGVKVRHLLTKSVTVLDSLSS